MRAQSVPLSHLRRVNLISTGPVLPVEEFRSTLPIRLTFRRQERKQRKMGRLGGCFAAPYESIFGSNRKSGRMAVLYQLS
jgi:hypothetical protein